MQSYFESSLFTIEEKQFLFKLRTSMSDVKMNFKTIFLNSDCDLCDQNEQQTEDNLKATQLIKEAFENKWRLQAGNAKLWTLILV